MIAVEETGSCSEWYAGGQCCSGCGPFKVQRSAIDGVVWLSATFTLFALLKFIVV